MRIIAGLLTLLLLTGCQGLFGTVAGESLYLTVSPKDKKTGESPVPRISRVIEKELGFERTSHEPVVRFNERVFSETVFANSEAYPDRKVRLSYYPKDALVRCNASPPGVTSYDSESREIIERILGRIKELYPNSESGINTRYRDFLGP